MFERMSHYHHGNHESSFPGIGIAEGVVGGLLGSALLGGTNQSLHPMPYPAPHPMPYSNSHPYPYPQNMYPYPHPHYPTLY